MTTRQRRNSAPGRPPRTEADDAQQRIVSTACLHFSRYGIAGSKQRQIAEDAGVTAAMINYYFKSREALHEAVLEQGFAPLLSRLPTVRTLSEWVECFHAHLCAHPWLPQMMIREVLAPNGQLRPQFLKRYAPVLFGAVRKLVAKELQGSKVRRNLDVDRHLVLLMGMLVYPFMTLEFAEDLTGRKFDERMFKGFRDDALQLFMKGVSAN